MHLLQILALAPPPKTVTKQPVKTQVEPKSVKKPAKTPRAGFTQLAVQKSQQADDATAAIYKAHNALQEKVKTAHERAAQAHAAAAQANDKAGRPKFAEYHREAAAYHGDMAKI
jgi:hypothetical protein